MSEPFLGEIRRFPYWQLPDLWLPCDGRLLPISRYQALYSLLGPTYGGDGRTSFALPNLSGRTPVGVGNGFALGQTGGGQGATQPYLPLVFAIATGGQYPNP
jgi:microcystin-dependent protein